MIGEAAGGDTERCMWEAGEGGAMRCGGQGGVASFAVGEIYETASVLVVASWHRGIVASCKNQRSFESSCRWSNLRLNAHPRVAIAHRGAMRLRASRKFFRIRANRDVAIATRSMLPGRTWPPWGPDDVSGGGGERSRTYNNQTESHREDKTKDERAVDAGRRRGGHIMCCSCN